jgi:hypothetical protein
MTNKREAASLLYSLARALEEMSEADFQRLLNGSGFLKFATLSPKRNKRKTSETSRMSAVELRTLIQRLQQCQSRDEVRQYLHEDPRAPLKDNLEQLTKLVNVHVNKHDRREAIEDKIVESVVGVKLRSEAILGLNLKGGS